MSVETLIGAERQAALEMGISISPPEDSVVLGVSDGGKLVARIVLCDLAHIERPWIEPEHRNGKLLDELVKGVEEAARHSGRHWLFAFAEHDRPDIASYLTRLGYIAKPVTIYAKELL